MQKYQKLIYRFCVTKYYEVLKLPKNSTKIEIKDRYYEMAKQYHPDVNPENIEYFLAIQQAYQILSKDSPDEDVTSQQEDHTQDRRYMYFNGEFSNPDMRRVYDEHRWEQARDRQDQQDKLNNIQMQTERRIKKQQPVADIYETLQSSNKKR